MSKIREKFPHLSDAHRDLILNVLVAGFQYVLDVGEDGVCEFLIEEDVNVSYAPLVQKRIDEYKRTHG